MRHWGSHRAARAALTTLAVAWTSGAAWLAADPAPASTSRPPAVSSLFESEVRPLLVDRCFNCHSGLTAEPAGGFRLDTREALLKGGRRGPSLVGGDPDRSLLIRMVRRSPGVPAMPPAHTLSPRQVRALEDWVRAGAPWTAESAGGLSDPWAPLWSLRPITTPSPPPLKGGARVASPIDAFLLHRLEREGLRPARPADRRTLIRRATLDLTGLPPTPEEVEAFVADPAPDAFAKVIDRLLASPRYGERWGRHWLDVARYADSNGLDENMAFEHAWRYRDYVIDAFNRDLPFDRFIRQQLAGDLLPRSGDRKQDDANLIATGFLALGPKMLAEDDPVKMEMDIIDEQVDSIGRAFMGLTLGCARCHDHKYDPVDMPDYYALAGIFKSTRSMEHFRVVAMWHENVLATPEEAARLKDAEDKVRAAEARTREYLVNAADRVAEDARRRLAEYGAAAAEAIRAEPLRRPLLEGAGAPPPGSLLIEAEAYARGNLLRDTSGYGRGIGVLVNAGPLPNFAEYDLNLPAGGRYRVDVRYAAAQSRPCRLTLNGSTVLGSVAGEVTGSWTPEGQKWFFEGLLDLPAGPAVLRLERADGPVPHVDKLLLAPAPAGRVPLTIEVLARERGLLEYPLRQWVTVLKGPAGRLPALQALLAADPAESAAAARRLKDLTTGPLTGESRALVEVLEAPGGPLARAEEPRGVLDEAGRAELARLESRKAELQKAVPALPRAMGVQEGRPVDLKVHLRGNYLTLGSEAPRRFLRVISGDTPLPDREKGSGRLALADWLASPAHPLTARVIVNRVWQWHFGEGLVRTPDNFGRLGERPTHPELLDWLADWFRKPAPDGGGGWRLKRLHRLIVDSDAYRMSAAFDARSAAKDPENRLLWRMNRQRMDAETLRDSLHAVAGTLDLQMGGNMLPVKNHQYVTSTANRDTTDYNSPRRAVYLPVVRSSLYDLFTAFDFGDPSVGNGLRGSTTVAPQALFMLNGELMHRQSLELARRLLALDSATDDDRVRRLLALAYGRPERPGEIARLLDFGRRVQERLSGEGMTPADAKQRAWQSVCRVVLASSEFVYQD